MNDVIILWVTYTCIIIGSHYPYYFSIKKIGCSNLIRIQKRWVIVRLNSFENILN